MKFTKYLLFLLLISFIGSAIYIAVQPNNYTFSKTKTIKAPQEIIHKEILDLNTWNNWGPWKKSNSSDSINNINEYTWLQDNSIGRITNIRTVKSDSIIQKIEFPEYSKAELFWKIDSLEPKASQVTWTMESKNIPFKRKALYALFGTPEKELAPKFEQSLVKLDSAVTKKMKAYRITVNGITQHSGGFYLYNTTSCKVENFPDRVKSMMPKVLNYVEKNHIPMAGFPFVLYHKWDEANNAVIFSCCIPTTTQIITTNNDILTGFLPASKTLKTTLKGDYQYLDQAWKTALNYLKSNQLEPEENAAMWETYLTNTNYEVNPANWITEIYIALKADDSTQQIDLSQIKLPE